MADSYTSNSTSDTYSPSDVFDIPNDNTVISSENESIYQVEHAIVGDNTKRVLLNEDNALEIQTSSDGGTTWVTKFFVDTNGVINAQELIISDGSGNVLIDGSTKSIDFSKFTTILGDMTADHIVGGTLTLGGVNNENGQLIIVDSNGETVANLTATNGGFQSLSIGSVSSPSLYNANSADMTLSVTDNLNDALHSIPPLNNGTATLTFQNDISGNIDISNYLGDGSIVIDLNGHALNGNVYIHGCAPQYINIKNGTINGQGNASSNAVVEVDRCTYVRFDTVKIYGSGSPLYGVYTHAGSTTYLSACEIYNVQEAVSAATGGKAIVDTCKGLGTTDGLHAFYGGRVTAFGSQPGGTTNNVLGTSGEIWPSGGTTVDTGSATPPPAPATTSQWSSTSYNDWSSSYSSWQNDSPRQGNWGYGQRTGYWFFGSNPSSAVTGKTISSMRVKVTRLSSGGYSSSTGIVIRSHNYTSVPSGAPSPTSLSSYSTTVDLAWGQSAWVSLPSSFFADFQSGTAKGIGIYTSSTSGSDYAVMNGNATLEITYS